MGCSAPEELIAPVYFQAEFIMRRIRKALDAELTVSELLGLISSSICHEVAADALEAALSVLVTHLVTFAEGQATPGALALLRGLSVVAPEPARTAAEASATRLADAGVPDRAWAKAIGRPTVGLAGVTATSAARRK